MKKILVSTALLFYFIPAVGQQKRIKVFNDKQIKIINQNIDSNPNKLPILTFTISNKSKEDVVFTNIFLGISDFVKHPLSSSSENELTSKVLNPIGGLDLPLPTQINGYLFGISSPILIAKHDFATVTIRLFCPLNNKNIVPNQLGYFKFRLSFLTDDFKAIQSQEIELGSR